MFGTVLKSKKKTYTVSFGLNSLIEVEQALYSVDSILENLSKELNLETIRILLYFGLNKEYSFEEVGNIVDELLEDMDITDICLSIQKAIFSSLGLNRELNIDDSGASSKKAPCH